MSGALTPAVLSPAAQQAAMLGAAGQMTGGTPGGHGYALTPGTTGLGGTVSHRGVATVIKEKVAGGKTHTLAVGLKVQREVFQAHETAKAASSWKNLHENQLDLKVFGIMGDGKKVRYVWGVGKVFDPSNEMDIATNDLTAFIGDRDKHGNSPPLVGLPPLNSVNWVKVTTKFDEAAFEAHYDDEANKNTFVQLDTGGGRCRIWCLGFFICRGSWVTLLHSNPEHLWSC